MYSTLALEKEREIVKEETALRKEKEAVYYYAVQGSIQSYSYIILYRQPQQLRKPHAHVYTCIYRQPRRLRKPHAHTDRHVHVVQQH